jgi:two-component system, sensor histidine kinase YesM
LLVSNTEDYLHLIMQQNQSIIVSSLGRVDEVTASLASDRFIYDAITQPLSGSFADQSVFRQELNRYLIRSVYVPLRGNYDTVGYWFFINESFPISTIYQDYSFPANKVLNGRLVTAMPFYSITKEQAGKVYWFFQEGRPAKIYAACLIRSSYNALNIPDLGILLLEFDVADLFGNIKQSTLSSNSVYYLVDPAGEVHAVVANEDESATGRLAAFLASKGLLQANLSSGDYSFRENNQLYNVLSLKRGWLLVGVTPFSDITRQTRQVGEFLIPVIVISLLAVFLLSYMIARSVSKPISTLSQIMRQSAADTNLDIAIPEHRETVEIATLYASYNALIERIKLLLKEVFEKGVSVKQAEIRALQAQINPHFLYNTLDSISWAALDLGDSEIPAVVSSLSNILRYSIKEPDKFATIEEELKITQDYVEIQNFCYSLDIHLLIEGEPVYPQQLLPKLTFQPIVENAILHGFLENNQKSGTIIFRTIDEGDCLRFEIENPGEADIARIEEIIYGSKEIQKHGLRNVHTRLQMLFGAGSGLSVSKKETGGLVVTLTVKKLKERN